MIRRALPAIFTVAAAAIFSGAAASFAAIGYAPSAACSAFAAGFLSCAAVVNIMAFAAGERGRPS